MRVLVEATTRDDRDHSSIRSQLLPPVLTVALGH